jgi:hypothetical protein
MTNTEIRAQILQKTNNKTLRREVLKHPDWGLEEVLKEARSLEASEARAGDIEGRCAEASPAAINKVADRKSGQKYKRFGNKRQDSRQYSTHHSPQHSTHQGQGPRGQGPKTCYNCGGQWPYEAGRDACACRGRKCNKCSAVGHFGKVCRNRGKGRQEKATAYNVDISDQGQEEAYVFSVGKGTGLPHVMVKVSGKPVRFLVDTGASLDLIDKRTYHLLGQPPLRKCRTQVFPYDSTTALKTFGQMSCCLESKEHYKETQLVVVDTEQAGNLLSYSTANALGLVKITVNAAVSSESGDSQSENTLKLMQKYPHLFTGVGKLKGYEAVIHIDPKVPSVAQRPRHVPFHMRKRVEEEIKRLKELDIIEEAHGTSTWVSPIVITEKKSGGYTPVHRQ